MFPSSADHEQDWQPYDTLLIHTLLKMLTNTTEHIVLTPRDEHNYWVTHSTLVPCAFFVETANQ